MGGRGCQPEGLPRCRRQHNGDAARMGAGHCQVCTFAAARRPPSATPPPMLIGARHEVQSVLRWRPNLPRTTKQMVMSQRPVEKGCRKVNRRSVVERSTATGLGASTCRAGGGQAAPGQRTFGPRMVVALMGGGALRMGRHCGQGPRAGAGSPAGTPLLSLHRSPGIRRACAAPENPWSTCGLQFGSIRRPMCLKRTAGKQDAALMSARHGGLSGSEQPPGLTSTEDSRQSKPRSFSAADRPAVVLPPTLSGTCACREREARKQGRKAGR